MPCVMKPTIEFAGIVAAQKASEAHHELSHDDEARRGFLQSGDLGGPALKSGKSAGDRMKQPSPRRRGVDRRCETAKRKQLAASQAAAARSDAAGASSAFFVCS